ncbi:MAG: hypothetical protein ACO3JG_14490 [Luteolibacter sp.]
MQRWIVPGIVIGIVAMVLTAVGGYFALKIYKQNRPAPVWVPLPINPDFSSEKTREIVNELKSRLSEPELLQRVSKDLALTGPWEKASDKECAAEIGRRLFVRSGEADTPMGKVPAIHVGVDGKRKEFELSGKIAMRLMDDVWPILGMDPPQKPEAD